MVAEQTASRMAGDGFDSIERPLALAIKKLYVKKSANAIPNFRPHTLKKRLSVTRWQIFSVSLRFYAKTHQTANINVQSVIVLPQSEPKSLRNIKLHSF
jgi:hypothetical protein